MQSTPKKLLVVAGAILEKSKLLIAMRGPRMSCPGLWELPGGKVEEGETNENALSRELIEELGIVVNVGERLAESRVVVGETHIQMVVFLCHRISGEPISLEHASLHWVGTEDLYGRNWAPADIPLVSKMAEWLENIRSGSVEMKN
jgi:8-oxo-dGTP diphosphatase